MKIFWKVVKVLILLLVFILLFFIVLDCTGYGNNPGDAVLYGFTSFVRGCIPKGALNFYEWFKGEVAVLCDNVAALIGGNGAVN